MIDFENIESEKIALSLQIEKVAIKTSDKNKR